MVRVVSINHSVQESRSLKQPIQGFLFSSPLYPGMEKEARLLHILVTPYLNISITSSGLLSVCSAVAVIHSHWGLQGS